MKQRITSVLQYHLLNIWEVPNASMISTVIVTVIIAVTRPYLTLSGQW